jgi:hypothetical protein
MVLVVGLALGLPTACNSEDDTTTSSETSAKKKRGGDEQGAVDAVDLNKLYAEEAPYGGSLDVFGEVTFGVTDHSPIEPEQFSAGWVGRESWDVLQRARKGEYPYKQVRMQDRRVCLVFMEGNIVRRAMAVQSATSPSEEMAFSAAGGLIFWYGNSRSKPPVQEWAYFHRNANMERFEYQSDQQPRAEATPGPEQYNQIIATARQCISAAGASNPTPGAALPPAPPPQTAGPPRGYFGSFVIDRNTALWRVA